MSSRIGSLLLMLIILAAMAACEVKTTEDARCGDGKMQPGEECDGTDVAGRTCLNFDYYTGALACSEDCKLDFSACNAGGSCGDGIIQVAFGESCDDQALGEATCTSIGHAGGVLACAADCTFDVSGCAVCGDEVISEPFEDCEDDDLQGASCENLGYYGGSLACSDQTCTYDTSNCETFGWCGDGTIQQSRESCDGANLNGHTCESLGYYGGMLTCNEGCSIDFTSCEAAGFCGDGIISAYRGEECDQTNFGEQTCRSLRHWGGTPVCNGACQITGCLNIVQIASGPNHSCARISDGTVRCWGSNQFGQLGDGTTTNSTTPVTVSGLADVISVSVGADATCAAVATSGALHCWGHNDVGQLGDGTTTDRHLPMLISAIASVDQVSLGHRFSCARQGSTGRIYCWGINNEGQLGRSSPEISLTPNPVLDQYNSEFYAMDLSVGHSHACGRVYSGIVYCWGANGSGQLGDGTTTSSPVPKQAAINMNTISAGEDHTCGVTFTREVQCWGVNSSGQLGNGTLMESTLPVTVQGLSTATSVAAGINHTCARLQNETVSCWGANGYGQLGTGSPSGSLTPVAVPGLATVDTIDASNSTCAVNLFGDAHCWGSNQSGQLGDGTLIDRTSPALVSE